MLLPVLISAAVALAPAAGPLSSIEAAPFDASTATTAPAQIAAAAATTSQDVCGALTVGGVQQLLQTPALAGVREKIPASLSLDNVVAVARSLFGCGPAPSDADPAQVKARVCAVINVDDLAALKSSLAAELALVPGLTVPDPTAANVAAARQTLGCSASTVVTTVAPSTTVAPTTSATTSTSAPTTSTTSSGGTSQVTQIPVGAADTGEGPGLPAPFWIAGALVWLVAAAALLTVYTRTRRA